MLRVARYTRLPTVEDVVLFAPSGEIGNLDLEALSSPAFVDVWQSLVTWGGIAMGSRLCLRDSVVRSVLDSTPTVQIGNPPAVQVDALAGDEESDLAEPVGFSSVSYAAKPLLVVANRGGILEDGGWVKVGNVILPRIKQCPQTPNSS